jgi:hypothetical protein
MLFVDGANCELLVKGWLGVAEAKLLKIDRLSVGSWVAENYCLFG